MTELSISNVIRVTVQGVQRSKGVKNINEVALFTNEPSNSMEPYIIAIDPSTVVKAYGTNSLTAKMAQNIFAQNANLNTGRGYLAVIPMQNAVNATAASFATPALTDIMAFKTVNDGSLKITTNGSAYEAKNMDFTNAATIADVASIIQQNFSDLTVSVNGTSIVFQAKTLGDTSSVVLSSGEGGTDISGADYLDVATGTTTAGTNSSGETLQEAIERTLPLVRYTGVLETVYREDSAITPASAYINSNDLIWMNVWYSASAINGACTAIQQAQQTQTRCLVYTNGFEDAKLMMAAYTGRAFSVNFSGSQTSQTMNLKTLVNVLPDNGIDQTAYTNAKAAGVDLYVSYEGDPGVLSSGGNSYFDTVYENMALKFHAQIGLYNALKTTGTKIPQTESGMASLRGALSQVFIQFVRNGVLAPGTWNSSQTFGDPETFRQNIENQGWYVYSMPIALQAQSEREQRIAPMIQGACKRAGAIHEADILILVEE